MKKINSIHYGGKILLIGGTIGLLIPIILWLLSDDWSSPGLFLMAKIASFIGMLILLFFFVLLAIELYQDRKINKYYAAHKNVKIRRGDNQYECAACGNRCVQKEDMHCIICGIRFEEGKTKTPQEILDSEK